VTLSATILTLEMDIECSFINLFLLRASSMYGLSMGIVYVYKFIGAVHEL